MFRSFLQRSVRLTAGQRNLSTYKPDMAAIKQLRAESQAPLKDVKEALTATEGDFPAAFEWLRKKGIASASKKADRATAEGLIGVHVQGTSGAIVEINSETDFVARNDAFQDLVSKTAQALASHNASNALLESEALNGIVVGDATLGDTVPSLIGKVGENVFARRGAVAQVDNGVVCSYLHNSVAPGLGRSGALVAIEYNSPATPEQQEAVAGIGHRLAMHVVAARPKYLNRDSVPEDVVSKEKAFLMDQSKDSGKPEHILEKMISGRLNKFFSEMTLLDQEHFIEEGSPKISKFLDEAGDEIGVSLQVKSYHRFEIGEEN